MPAVIPERLPRTNMQQPVPLQVLFDGSDRGAPTAWTRPIARMPYRGRLRAASVTIGTTLALHAVNFLTLRLSVGGTNVTSAMTTEATALTANTPRAFTVTEVEADLADNDVILLTVTPATNDASLDMSAVRFLVDCEIVPI